MNTETEKPYISHEPGKQGGVACLSRTRMTVECVVLHWWQGEETLEQMLSRGWPVEDRNSLLACCWYASQFWRKPWRHRWGPWLKQWGHILWLGEWDKVALPPQKEKKA